MLFCFSVIITRLAASSHDTFTAHALAACPLTQNSVALVTDKKDMGLIACACGVPATDSGLF